jgi:hypothetical protein
VAVVVGKVFFDHIAFVTTQNDELIEAVAGINFHDVPKYGFTPDFDHGLGLRVVSSESREPRPPARINTFIISRITRMETNYTN